MYHRMITKMKETNGNRNMEYIMHTIYLFIRKIILKRLITLLTSHKFAYWSFCDTIWRFFASELSQLPAEAKDESARYIAITHKSIFGEKKVCNQIAILTLFVCERRFFSLEQHTLTVVEPKNLCNCAQQQKQKPLTNRFYVPVCLCFWVGFAISKILFWANVAPIFFLINL